MKNMFFFLWMLIAIFFFVAESSAQSSKRALSSNSKQNTKSANSYPNYYTIIRDYEHELSQSKERIEGEKEKDGDHDDWKYIERWKWFWGPRVDINGNFPPAGILMREWEKSGFLNAKLKMDGTLGTNALAQWKLVGPAVIPENGGGMGRINCVRVPDRQLNTIWIGTACGGAWKSTDGGINWHPMTDYLPALSVSDIAVHPNSVNTVFIATGDADATGTYVHYSAGILRSDDGGKTWNPTGLSYRQNELYVIRRLLINPATPNIMLAATNRGILLSSDAGASWNSVQSGNFRDMEYQPNNPLTVYASTSGAIYKSANAGKTWVQLTTTGITGAVNLKLAVTPANPAYIYALASNSNEGFGGLWLSTDAGASWKIQSTTPNLLGWSVNGSDNRGQGSYDLAIAVSRTKANTVTVGGVNVWQSTLAGTSWNCIAHWYGDGGKPYVHADVHDLICTLDGKIYASTDGGVFLSQDDGMSWIDLSKGLSITQFYRIGVGATNSNIVIGGAQDNGTSRYNGTKWHQVIGGDGMNCLVDYKNANISYGALYYGDIYRTTDNWTTSKSFINRNITQESGAWVAPYQLHPTDPNTAFAGFRNVWRTTTAGGSWEKISNFNQGSLTILEIAESNPNYIYAGNSNGFQYTTDGGATWKNLALNVSSGSVTSIEIDPKKPNRIWIGISGYSAQDVLETSDFGATWKDISAGLPALPTNCIVYQKNSPDRMYAGTDIGIYYRDTLTKVWIAFNDGMPATIVSDLQIHYATGKLYAGTYGRGIWMGNLANCNTKIDLAVTRKGNLTFCEGDSVVLTAQSGYSSYLWTNGATTQSIVVKTSGAYSASAITSNGCPAVSVAFDVVAMPKSKPGITFSKSRPVLCGDADSVQLNASLGFATYRWNSGDTSRRIIVRKPGKYVVAVTKPGNCDATSDTIEVVTVTPQHATISQNGNTLTANPAGIAYEWYLNGEKIPNATSRTYSYANSKQKIRVMIIDSNGCRSISDEIVVSVQENILASQGLTIKPNPTSGSITVNLLLPAPSELHIEIITLDGRIVSNETQFANEIEFTSVISFSGLPDGVYYLRIVSGEHEWKQQVVYRR